MIWILYLEYNIYNQMKHKKHKKIVDDYDTQKSKHLDYLGTLMLKQDDKSNKLKEKRINIKILNLF